MPLHERVRPAGSPPPEEPCPGRHCWVVGGAGLDPGTKRPGLLVEWRHTDTGWQGRVVYLARLDTGRWSLVEEWLDAPYLTPA